MNNKLGLKPVTAQPTIRLASYYTADLPSVDSLKFPLGHSDLIIPKMFCNNVIGDCAIAGSIEEVRLANAIRGVDVTFTDKTAVENYASITSYQPGPEIEGFNDDGSAVENPDAPQNPTDDGTDVHDLYTYRQTTGLVDADGNTHKIVGYAGLTPGDWDELLIALSLFQMVGIGIKVPDYAETQFEAGQPWHLQRGRHQIVGGHYIPVVDAANDSEAGLFTWGAHGGITAGFYSALSNVAVVALTEEMFGGDHPAAGIVDFQTLTADLPALNTGPVMAKAPRGKRRQKDEQTA